MSGPPIGQGLTGQTAGQSIGPCAQLVKVVTSALLGIRDLAAWE